MATAIDYSTTPEPATLELFPWNQLAQLIATVKHAASRDTRRYNLNAIYLELDTERGSLTATATDGHRLAQSRIPVPKDALVGFPEKGFMLTLDDVDRILGESKRLAKVLGKARYLFTRARLTFTDAAMLVETYEHERAEEPSDTLRCKPLADAEFPNYRQVIGTHAPAAAFNGRYMAEAFKVLGEVVERSHAVKLSMPTVDSTGCSAKPDCYPWRLDTTSPDGLEVMAIVMPMRL